MTTQEIFGAGFGALSSKEKLQKAATELEAVVLAQLLGSMRKTVPESGLFGKSVSNDIFRTMLDGELARATEALRGSVEKYRSIVDNIGIGIALISPDIYGEVLDLINGAGTDAPDAARVADDCSTLGGSPPPSLEVLAPAVDQVIHDFFS